MKHLDKVVFWMGFTLSLGALYASSERFNPHRTGLEPVVLEIPAGRRPVSQPKLGSAKPLEPIPVESAEDELWRARMAGFLSAAEEALR